MSISRAANRAKNAWKKVRWHFRVRSRQPTYEYSLVFSINVLGGCHACFEVLKGKKYIFM